MVNYKINIRKARYNDLVVTWVWRNDTITRLNSLTLRKVLIREYGSWFRKKINSKEEYNFISFDAKSKKKIALTRFEVYKKSRKV